MTDNLLEREFEQQGGYISKEFYLFRNIFVVTVTRKKIGKKLAAKYDPERREIVLRLEKDDSINPIVLLHQLTHAAIDITKFFNDPKVFYEFEEGVCAFVACNGAFIIDAASKIYDWWHAYCFRLTKTELEQTLSYVDRELLESIEKCNKAKQKKAK